MGRSNDSGTRRAPHTSGLGQAHLPIGKMHASNGFELAPSATAELFSQLSSLAN
jgi:hypothetical protein